ncbi:hypothetical protein [Methanococcoides sp. LMO-2]|uniref:Helicase ATP-binding domain-containing protein n=1 Tax=Methanococcoides cohabitans TaxID=3136559 RepID=A0ABU9KVM8_9EURY
MRDGVLHDKRTIKALEILDSDDAIIKAFKVARAGATTSLVLACILLGKKLCIIEPTNKIKSETILNVNKLLAKYRAKIIQLYNNFECILIKARIEANPHLENFPYLLKPVQCTEETCIHYNECKVTEFLRSDAFDVVAFTYDKLNAIMKTSSVAQILDKIRDECDVVIFDEAHKFAFPNTIPINILELTNYEAKFPPIDISNINDVETLILKFEKNGGKLQNVDDSDIQKYKNNLDGFITDFGLEDCVTDGYMNERRAYFKLLLNTIPKEYKKLRKLVQTFLQIINSKDVTTAETNVIKHILDSEVKTYEKHQTMQIDNVYNELFFIDKSSKSVEDVVEIIKLLMEELENYCVEKSPNRDFVTSIFDMLNVVQNPKLTIHGMQDTNNNITINIVAMDINFLNSIRSFLSSMENKKVIYTTATFTDFDYGILHPHKKIKDFMFGDPLNTNEKLTIFPDTKIISPFHGRNSFYNHRHEVEQKCVTLFRSYGAENFIIFCVNIAEWNYWKDRFKELGYYEEDKYGNATENSPQLTYYQASDAMGVECDKRMGIAIGIQHIPKHAHDPITNSAELSQISRLHYAYINAFQAWSRVKDPNGKELSFLFALGCNESEVRNIVKWGTNPKMQINEYEDKRAREIIRTFDELIPEPIVQVEKSWSDISTNVMVSKACLEGTQKICHYI